MNGEQPAERRPRLQFTQRRAGEVLTAGFEVFGRAWRELLVIAVVVTFPLTIAETAVGAWLISEASVVREAGSAEALDASFWTAAAATIAAALIGFAVTLIVQAAATRAATQVLVGRDPSVAESYRTALSRTAPILGATLLIALGAMAGLLLLVVPGIFVLVRWSVTVQAIVVERLGGIAGMRRSWNLVRGEGWHAFAVFLVLSLLSGLAGQLVARAFPPDVLWQGVAAAIVQSIVLPFTTAVYVVLYVNLRISKEGLDASTLEAELDR